MTHAIKLGSTVVHCEDLGAALLSVHVAGDEIVAGDLAYAGSTLTPWPNRISPRAWSWEGRTFEAPRQLHQPRTVQLHGLVADRTWTVQSQTESTITYVAELWPDASYPSRVDLAVTYSALEDGVRCDFAATNHSAAPAPLAVAWHPYVRCADVAGSFLVVDATEQLAPDNLGIPAVPVRVTSTDIPLDHHLDDSFRLSPKVHSVSVKRHGERPIRLTQSANMGWVHLYTATHNGQIALEPMSAPANALHSHRDLWTLPPGGHTTAWWTLELA